MTVCQLPIRTNYVNFESAPLLSETLLQAGTPPARPDYPVLAGNGGEG